MNSNLPAELIAWLNTLPKLERQREEAIAIKNLRRITNHLMGGRSK